MAHRAPDIRSLEGEDLAAALDALARLRIEVFRDYPYLYDGEPSYERSYLEIFAAGRDSVIIAALDGDAIVGCATGSALSTAHPPFLDALRSSGADPDGAFYFGESVLSPAYRGRGLGHAFFDRREAHARRLGYTTACFCAVIRDDDHPLRPPAYRGLEPFWRRRGYLPVDGAVAHFEWKDIDQPESCQKPMQFWSRRL
jgi:GNAT superfamily N-acetyltransferase